MDIDEDHRPRYMVFSKVSLFGSKLATLREKINKQIDRCKSAMALSQFILVISATIWKIKQWY